jgi:hypothetical protein
LKVARQSGEFRFSAKLRQFLALAEEARRFARLAIVVNTALESSIVEIALGRKDCRQCQMLLRLGSRRNLYVRTTTGMGSLAKAEHDAEVRNPASTPMPRGFVLLQVIIDLSN